MLPQTQKRKKANSSKVNFTISAVFHIVLAVVVFYFAAREGLLGKKMQKISVNMIKEKQPEKPKEVEKPKVEPPKVEPPKVEPPKVEPPKLVEETKPTAPPVAAPPVAAPPSTEIPSLEFDGGKEVVSVGDPVQLYKNFMEYELRSKWNRPDNMDDNKYVAEVQVKVDKDGNLGDVVWQKGSGNAKWDQTVKDVFNVIHVIGHRPPTNFPPQVVIRFDVQEETEPLTSP